MGHPPRKGRCRPCRRSCVANTLTWSWLGCRTQNDHFNRNLAGKQIEQGHFLGAEPPAAEQAQDSEPAPAPDERKPEEGSDALRGVSPRGQEFRRDELAVDLQRALAKH